jgi:hypothetical protein
LHAIFNADFYFFHSTFLILENVKLKYAPGTAQVRDTLIIAEIVTNVTFLYCGWVRIVLLHGREKRSSNQSIIYQ